MEFLFLRLRFGLILKYQKITKIYSDKLTKKSEAVEKTRNFCIIFQDKSSKLLNQAKIDFHFEIKNLETLNRRDAAINYRSTI